MMHADCHQDLFTRKCCGEGAPDWAVDLKADGPLPFPLPISLEVRIFSFAICILKKFD